MQAVKLHWNYDKSTRSMSHCVSHVCNNSLPVCINLFESIKASLHKKMRLLTMPCSYSHHTYRIKLVKIKLEFE